MTALTADRLLYTPAELATATGLSESTIRQAINATETTSFPPLAAKRIRRDGSPKTRLFITADAARAWLAAFPDA